MTLSIYQRVTNAILEQLDTADPASWICPWHRTGGGLPTNALTGRSYRGINVLSLWCGARAAGYDNDRWATYRQWAELGAKIRRGEKGTLVVFYKDLSGRSSAAEREDAGVTGEKALRFVARASCVFNAAQVDGAPDLPAVSGGAEPTPNFDQFVAATGAIIRIGGERACYVPGRDEILMPARESFRSVQGYTATLAHELIHWSGAEHRLDRDLSTRFGSQAYAAEELIAELGSAFVLAGLGLANEPHPNHAAYMAGWLPLLRSDPRAIFTAAAQASRAAEWLALSRPLAAGCRQALPAALPQLILRGP